MQLTNNLQSKQDKALGELVRHLDTANFPEALSHFVSKIVTFDNMIIIAYHKDHNPESYIERATMIVFIIK